MAEADGHLRQKLQQVLKLSKEKWDDARDHAMRAVVADNRMRIWYADKTNMELGLLFTCRLGNVDLDRPVGLLQKKSQDGTQTTMEATLMAQQTPSQREQAGPPSLAQLTPLPGVFTVPRTAPALPARWLPPRGGTLLLTCSLWCACFSGSAA